MNPVSPLLFLLVLLTTAECAGQLEPQGQQPYVVVLGIAQDGGFPQAGCRKDCCRDVPGYLQQGPTSIAVVDPNSGERWLFECTPRFPNQLKLLDLDFPVAEAPGIDGIFLTHAHIGHYAGLVHLGREVMGTRDVPVYAMPRMTRFLQNNGPWSQLVELKNIRLQSLQDEQAIQLNERIRVTPITVPHRDEFSETVAFRIEGPARSVFFLPDIDKWERWETRIESVLDTVDIAYLDATFFNDDELPGRNMAEIPHPFVVESIARFQGLPQEVRQRVRFIHLNHTNPALLPDSAAAAQIKRGGMNVASRGERIGL